MVWNFSGSDWSMYPEQQKSGTQAAMTPNSFPGTNGSSDAAGERTEMTDSSKETLSALMDGQGDELELRRLLKTLDSDPEAADTLLAAWQRYHLVQDLLHDRGTPVSAGLASNIAAALAEEPALQGAPGGGWRQTVAKFAIAASVAAVFVVGMQSSLQQSPGAGPAPALVSESTQPAPTDAVATAAPGQAASTMLAGNEAMTVDPQAAERLRNYLEGIAIDVSEPAVTQHIQDSPLYRLVNQVQDQPDTRRD